MKTNVYLIKSLLAVSILLLTVSLWGQNITITGVVKDKQTNKKLSGVNILVPNTGVGTITNADGEFTFKIKDSLNAKQVDLALIGYFTSRVALRGKDIIDTTIYLSANAIELSEAFVFKGDGRKLVEEAIRKIESNYCTEPSLLTGFYRETVQKRRSYIGISEAVINIYKTPYKQKGEVTGDKVQIIKGRQLLSQKSGDTIMVKFQGGPNLPLFVDIVKNPALLLDADFLSDYKFEINGSVMIDERPHFIVNVTPQAEYSYPLYVGKLYIDSETLAFSRAELSFNMDDRNKVTKVILEKKPFNLRFKPEEVSFLITYKQSNGKTYINYVRNEMRFKCDWKRKLFSTNYAIVSEMVVVDRKIKDVESIPNKQAFKQSQSFVDNVARFIDANFWKDYNIIEPTESLEKAVGKLKKQKT